jgi:hypothetical protein
MLVPPARNVDAPGDPRAALRLHIFQKLAQRVNSAGLSNQARMPISQSKADI